MPDESHGTAAEQGKLKETHAANDVPMHPGEVVSSAAPLHVAEPAHAAAAAHERESRIWARVSHSPIGSMWDLQGVSLKELGKRTWQGIDDDNLFGRASQLAYSFFAAIFPALIAMSAIVGLVAQSSSHVYLEMLNLIGRLIPPSAFALVLQTFQQTTSASTAGKVSLGLLVALFSASTGISAVQDTLNTVYRVRETRPFWRARLEAMGITVLDASVVIFVFLIVIAGDVAANWLEHRFTGSFTLSAILRVVAWTLASMLMVIAFEVLYFLCPNLGKRRWRWFTPGALIGLAGWVAGSITLRIYLHFFNSYSVTYGSLGAVIILLLWFYLTGLMILLGAEVNSEIERAVTERAVAQTPAAGTATTA